VPLRSVGAVVPDGIGLVEVPSGTTAPADRSGTPESASQRAPSGEPARPTERR